MHGSCVLAFGVICYPVQKQRVAGALSGDECPCLSLLSQCEVLKYSCLVIAFVCAVAGGPIAICLDADVLSAEKFKSEIV